MTKMTIKKRWHAISDQFEQAIQQGDLPAITHLIEKAKLLREEDVRWANFIHCFRWTTKPVLRAPCEYSNLVALEKLIEAGADINKVELFSGEYIDAPLHIAIKNANVGLVKYLINLISPREGTKRADLEVPSAPETQYLPQTPLMCAVERGHMEIIRLLIEAGADVNGILPGDASDAEAFDDELSANQNLGESDFVVSFPYDGNTIWIAFDLPETAISLTSDPQIIKMLLDAGADPNLDGRGDPLKLAVERGRLVAAFMARWKVSRSCSTPAHASQTTPCGVSARYSTRRQRKAIPKFMSCCANMALLTRRYIRYGYRQHKKRTLQA